MIKTPGVRGDGMWGQIRKLQPQKRRRQRKRRKIPNSHSRGVIYSHLGSVMRIRLQPRKAQKKTEIQNIKTLEVFHPPRLAKKDRSNSHSGCVTGQGGSTEI